MLPYSSLRREKQTWFGNRKEEMDLNKNLNELGVTTEHTMPLALQNQRHFQPMSEEREVQCCQLKHY